MSDGHLSKCDEIPSREKGGTGTCSEKEPCAEGSLTVELMFCLVRWHPSHTMEEGAGE